MLLLEVPYIRLVGWGDDDFLLPSAGALSITSGVL